jgi:hypothetical protein
VALAAMATLRVEPSAESGESFDRETPEQGQ